jgi:hypothetical protein
MALTHAEVIGTPSKDRGRYRHNALVLQAGRFVKASLLPRKQSLFPLIVIETGVGYGVTFIQGHDVHGKLTGLGDTGHSGEDERPICES